MGLLVLAVAACGGGGDGSSTPFGGPPSNIFVADTGDTAIGSSAERNPPAGVSVIQRVIFGSNTMLSSSLADLALDAAGDRLYVADLRSILVFNNAGTAAGNLAPARVVSSFVGLGSFVALYLDTLNERLYAPVNLGALLNEVRVFDSAGTASNAAPSRTFSFNSNFVIDVAVDAGRNMLYALHLNSTTNLTEIAVFDNAGALSGVVTPNRVITIGSSFSAGTAVGIFVDPTGNRLYVPNFGQVLVFDNASTKNGPISGAAAPERTITLPVAGITHLAVDVTADRLYATDNGGLTIIQNASTVNGIPPSSVRALAPPGSVFRALAVRP
jgi:hypothetical protein